MNAERTEPLDVVAGVLSAAFDEESGKIVLSTTFAEYGVVEILLTAEQAGELAGQLATAGAIATFTNYAEAIGIANQTDET